MEPRKNLLKSTTDNESLILSVVIPAHNEEGCIENTVVNLFERLTESKIEHEILVIDDNSKDNTARVLEKLKSSIPTLRVVFNEGRGGFGMAVRRGLEHFGGDVVAVFMADESDDPSELVNFYRVLLREQVDCVFGSRFVKGSKILDYPFHKLILNRFANLFIRMLFGIGYNDTTNAFKMYRRYVIDGLKPFLSHHFNLTVELPLKVIIRGYSYVVVPNSWTNRKHGVSKLRIREMGSRYLFIVLYCILEKWLSRGDYKRVILKEAVNRSDSKKAA